MPVSHRISTGRRSSSLHPSTTLRGSTPLGLNFSGFGLTAFGPPCSCCCVQKPTLAAFDLPKCLYCCCCFLCCFAIFLLLLDVGFSCCGLFFLLFVLLLLPLLRFAVVYGVAFDAAVSCCCCCLCCCFCRCFGAAVRKSNPPLQLLTKCL